MFGFHINREWATGARPTLAHHVASARAFFDDEGGAGGAEAGRPFAFQVFVAGPRHMRFTVAPDEARQLREYIRASNAEGRPTWGVAHGTYMDLPWNTDKPSFHWTTKWIQREVRRVASAGLSGLVVHLNSVPAAQVLQVLPLLIPPTPTLGHMLADEPDPDADADNAELERWGCFIRRCAPLAGVGAGARHCVRLYLETPHLKLAAERSPARTEGLVPYDTPEKLCELFRRIRATVDPNLTYFGLCIDTAHLWSCGQDIATREGAADWIRRFEEHARGVFELGPAGGDQVILHLNDEVHARGSGRDEHARLARGVMWGAHRDRPQASGLQPFVDFAQRWGVPTVLERKGKPAGKDPEGVGFDARAALAADLAVLRAVADA